MWRSRWIAGVLIATTVGAVPAGTSERDVVGEVRFVNSCDPAFGDDFNDAAALLHSFELEDARASFQEVARRDEDCAMAHWGVAMTYYHRPGPADGRRADASSSSGPKTVCSFSGDRSRSRRASL